MFACQNFVFKYFFSFETHPQFFLYEQDLLKYTRIDGALHSNSHLPASMQNSVLGVFVALIGNSLIGCSFSVMKVAIVRLFPPFPKIYDCCRWLMKETKEEGATSWYLCGGWGLYWWYLANLGISLHTHSPNPHLFRPSAQYLSSSTCLLPI